MTLDGWATLGGALRQLREEAPLTREQLARKARISVRTIAALELGTVEKPRVNTLEALLSALDVTQDTRARVLVLASAGPDEIGRSAPTAVPDPTLVVGRDEEIAEAVEHLRDCEHESRSWVLTGFAGVGKSATAVTIAAQLAEDFPDGQIVVDLVGAFRPRSQVDVLREILEASGLPPSWIVNDVDELAGQMRARLAGRRILLVLDDAPEGADLSPLLPGSPGIGVLITSRAPVVGFPATEQRELTALDLDSCLGAFADAAGADRIDAETEDARRLAILCGGIPWSVSLVAGWLAAEPALTLAEAFERLRAEHERDEEPEEVVDVRALLRTVTSDLDDLECAVLTAVGDLQAPTGPSWMLAAWLGIDLRLTGDIISALADRRLLTATPGERGRYRVHHLTRWYAMELAKEVDYADRVESVERLLDWWRAMADAAALRLPSTPAWVAEPPPLRFSPQPSQIDTIVGHDAVAWCAQELPVVLTTLVRVVDLAPRVPVWPLISSLLGYVSQAGWLDGFAELWPRMRAAAAESGDSRGRGVMELLSLNLDLNQRDPASTLGQLTEARKLFETVGDRWGALAVRIELATQIARMAYFDDDSTRASVGLGHARIGVDDARRLGHAPRLSDALLCLGRTLRLVGDLDAAREALQEARTLLDGTGYIRNLAQIDWQAALALHEAGDPSAIEVLHSADRLVVQLGDTWGLSSIRLDLGQMYAEAGDLDRAREILASSRESAIEIGNDLLRRQAERRLDALDREPGSGVGEVESA